MSKRVIVDIDLEETDSYLQIDIHDHDDYYMLAIERIESGVRFVLTEQVISKENLIELRDSLNLMIGDAT